MFGEIVENEEGDIDVAVSVLFESRVWITTELILGLIISSSEITSTINLSFVIIRASLFVPDNVN